MPALPNAPQVARVACSGTNQGATWANIFHISFSATTPTGAQLSTWAATFAGLYNTHFFPRIENEVFLTEVDVVDLTTPSSNQGTWTGSQQGDVVGAVNPANVAVCISWKQNLRYRGGHPRTYLTGIPTAANANNQRLTPTYQGYYLTAAQNFLNAVDLSTLAGGAVALGALSYYSKSVTPTPPHLRPAPLFLPFLDAACHGRLDTQRRRLGRVA